MTVSPRPGSNRKRPVRWVPTVGTMLRASGLARFGGWNQYGYMDSVRFGASCFARIAEYTDSVDPDVPPPPKKGLSDHVFRVLTRGRGRTGEPASQGNSPVKCCGNRPCGRWSSMGSGSTKGRIMCVSWSRGAPLELKRTEETTLH